jgi:hypothetical protein
MIRYREGLEDDQDTVPVWIRYFSPVIVVKRGRTYKPREIYPCESQS